MLRLRDILAVLAIVILTRLAYDDPSESLAATVQLNYYVGRESKSGVRASSKDHMQKLALAPLGMDVDGDGTIEALASWAKDTKSSSWSLEILDLKPAASTDKTHMAPFRPQQLYHSDELTFQSDRNKKEELNLLPITMATGHVPVPKKGKSASGDNEESKTPLTKAKFKDTELNDRNRHYFCGTDWHDASTKCGAPCPSGTSGDCPDGEQCFADTPCDINDYDPHAGSAKKEEGDTAKVVNDMLVSPAGGLPSVFSLWSNGVLVMHSLTGDAPAEMISVKKKQNRMKDLLGVRKMWEADIIKDASVVPYDWDSVSITFVDATDAGDDSGMIVVQAHMVHMEDDGEGGQEEYEDQFFVAFDAYTGKKLWDMSLIQKDEENNNSVNSTLPLQFGDHSSARRRSMKPFVSQSKNERLDANCMHAYRRSLFTSGALPHSYFGNADAESVALHFEQQQHNQHKQHAIQAKKFHGKPGSENTKGSWKNALSPFARRRHSNNKPKRGKPNVIASRSDHGLAIHSLKNGRSVCHTSLWYDTLYADVNHDGVLDGLFVITGDHLQEDDDDYVNADRKWIKKLQDRLKDKRMLTSDFGEDEKIEDQSQRLCHLLALSGVPVKEELFSINLCGKNELEDVSDELDAAPLLAVEPSYGKGKDVVVALNNKSVQRYRGTNGRRVWKVDGKHHADFPTWEEGEHSLLDRIEVSNVAPQARPIVLTGDNSITLLSPRRGSVLATATFPQPVIRRPILVDFNGDGTSDVVVVTNEAVWGYRVKVRTGSSIMFRIVVGLLAMGLMLAVIRNRFGPHPGKRGTDA